MKVLLIKDVYKLGRAGEVKKVAAGYGRNYLIPQGLALPATSGALGQADRIKEKATERRAVLNEELSSVAEVLAGKTLTFPVKAGETGRLYGSVSSDDIMEAIKTNFEIDLEKRQIETEPIRQLGTHTVPIHLTMDLMPEITVIVYQEGEAPGEEEETEAEVEAEVEDSSEATADDVEAPESSEDSGEAAEVVEETEEIEENADAEE